MAGWYADAGDRMRWVERNGLPVLFTEARISADGFVALYLEADEAVLPRSNVSRGFELHVSLGYRQDYPDGMAEVLCEHVNAQWSNRYHVLDIEWVGHGGAAMIHAEDPLRQDLVIQVTHACGYYGARQLHVSL